jgi:hypothetical protein
LRQREEVICGSARKGSPHKRLAENLMSWLTLTVLGGLSTTTNGAVGRACGSPTFRAPGCCGAVESGPGADVNGFSPLVLLKIHLTPNTNPRTNPDFSTRLLRSLEEDAPLNNREEESVKAKACAPMTFHAWAR